jgi:hypothetical protein
MIFTGKNKENFEKWFHTDGEENYEGLDSIVHSIYQPYDAFKSLPFSMQSGVYLEYLDSIGVVIDVDSEMCTKEKYFEYTIDGINGHESFDDMLFETRQEALTEAFKKTDEIINSK